MKHFLSFLLAWSAGSACAQGVITPPAVEPENPAIVIKGQSAPVVRSYVKKIATPVQGRQIPRWNEPICIGINGISEEYANFIRERISNLANSIGLSVRRPGCQVNLSIAMTDHADLLAKAMIEARPKEVGNINHDGLLQPSMVAAVEATRTIRWLTASETVSGSGGTPFGTTLRTYDSSVISTHVREDLVAKTIIIDELRLKDLTLAQLADYIAFVSLGTPDLTTDYSGIDTIMALFSKDAETMRPQGLTDADRHFLRALYKTTTDQAAHMQQSAIAENILREERSGEARQ